MRDRRDAKGRLRPFLAGGISLLGLTGLTMGLICCGSSLEKQHAARQVEEAKSMDDPFEYLRVISGDSKVSKLDKREITDRLWALVQIFDAVPAYDLFLEKLPRSPWAEAARGKRTEALERWPEPLRSDPRISLTVEADGPEDIFGAGVFRERISAVLKDYFGLGCAAESSEARPSLKVRIWGEGRSAVYIFPNRTESLYTGAFVQGRAICEWPGRPPIEAEFHGEVRPPGSAGFQAEKLDEKNAPFDRAMAKKGSLNDVLMDVLAERISPDSLFYAYVRSRSPHDPAIDMSELLIKHKNGRIPRQMAEWIRLRSSLYISPWDDSKELYSVLGKLIGDGDLEALNILRTKTGSPDPVESFWPLVYFGSRGDRDAVTALLRLYASPPHGARREGGQERSMILRALGESGDRRALEPIGLVLRTEHDSDLLEAALIAAGHLGGDEAVSLLSGFEERIKARDVASPGLEEIRRDALRMARSPRSSE